MIYSMKTVAEFKVGERVQAHPGTDTWMRGDRYGQITTIGRIWITVLMDQSGRKIKFHPNRLLHIGE